MAAHAAVISLLHTIERIQKHSLFRLPPPSQEIIQLAYEKLEPLQKILERLDSTRTCKSRKKINALDGRIKEAIWRFADLLESHVRDRILLQLETHQYLLRRRRKARFRRQLRSGKKRDTLSISMDLQGLQHDVDSFILELESMENDYVEELNNLPDEEEGGDEETVGFGGRKSKMVGLSDHFKSARSFFIEKCDTNSSLCLYGMAGIGKTTLAEEIFEDLQIRSQYEHRVWVKVGRKARAEEYCARAILAQLDPNHGKEDERGVVECLIERLEDLKCLIVLDDVWEYEDYDSVLCWLPRSRGFTHLLLTCRNRLFTHTVNYMYLDEAYQVVRFMNENESTNLLCKKVFGEDGSLPSRLEKAARKIARNCEGLPLLIVAVADCLSSEGDMTEEYWNEVAEKQNSVFVDALDEISKVLFPSYDYLPQHLKMFFLYLGVFPPDCYIAVSKLTSQLTGEGWIFPTNNRKLLESEILHYLDSLCLWHHLVLFKKKSRRWHPTDYVSVVKTCRLHCSWRHLCQVEARKNKFYQVLNRCIDASEEVIKGQRCLCLHNNVLFAIEDMQDSVKRYCASSTRSLHCFGPYHQYPVPIDVGFKLLRELNALNLRFYTFRTEILELVHLKYLALTSNGEIPPTISKLIQLQVFILHPHTNIKIRGAPLFIPVQIWDMEQLEHVEILGRSFRAPYHDISLMRLTTLLGANASITTLLKVCDKFPKVKKLGIQIEFTPYDDDTDILNCFHFISKLPQMETFKCSIVNPHITLQFLAPPTPNSFNFSCAPLKKLHLSGMGFPWEFMDVFGSLPDLLVLKLRCYAFRGPMWNVKENSFPSLEFLLIEDSDLEEWTLGPGCFKSLSYLSMKHCYKLRKLHWPSAARWEDKKVELVDCNPSVVTSAEQIQQSIACTLNLSVTSSYGNHK